MVRLFRHSIFYLYVKPCDASLKMSCLFLRTTNIRWNCISGSISWRTLDFCNLKFVRKSMTNICFILPMFKILVNFEFHNGTLWFAIILLIAFFHTFGVSMLFIVLEWWLHYFLFTKYQSRWLFDKKYFWSKSHLPNSNSIWFCMTLGRFWDENWELYC